MENTKFKVDELPEAFNSLKSMKLQLERTKMENLWIALFLPARAKSILSMELVETRNYVGIHKKIELCDLEIKSFEHEIDKTQDVNIQEVKNLNAQTKNCELSIQYYQKAMTEFNRAVLTQDGDSIKESFVKFLKNLIQNITVAEGSVRMKIGTMKR